MHSFDSHIQCAERHEQQPYQRVIVRNGVSALSEKALTHANEIISLEDCASALLIETVNAEHPAQNLIEHCVCSLSRM